jgi:hypothetical protein
MDAADNDSAAMMCPRHSKATVAPHTWGKEHPAVHPESPDPPDSWTNTEDKLPLELANTVEMREARVRVLQEAIKSGIYDVSAEQLAEKILQDLLREQLQ